MMIKLKIKLLSFKLFERSSFTCWYYIDLLIVMFTRHACNLVLNLFEMNSGHTHHWDYWPPCKKWLDVAEFLRKEQNREKQMSRTEQKSSACCWQACLTNQCVVLSPFTQQWLWKALFHATIQSESRECHLTPPPQKRNKTAISLKKKKEQSLYNQSSFYLTKGRFHEISQYLRNSKIFLRC